MIQPESVLSEDIEEEKRGQSNVLLPYSCFNDTLCAAKPAPKEVSQSCLAVAGSNISCSVINTDGLLVLPYRFKVARLGDNLLGKTCSSASITSRPPV